MNRRYQRLWVTQQEVTFLFQDHERISIVEAHGDPPDKYIIEYRVRGLVESGDEIVEREMHRVQITLGENYPREAPFCVMLTPVFHPNIDGYKICTEDITPAGRRLDQIIVFIGRLLTYQAMNLSSPRNGEARLWAEQHQDRFPLEDIELLPQAILDGTPLPRFTADDIPSPSPPPPVSLVEDQPRCANCGQSFAATSSQCASGHQVCADCSLACCNCNAVLCALCEIHTCSECKSPACSECWIACSSCERALCTAHASFCPVCGAPRCPSCLSTCVVCEIQVCATHLDESARCPACGAARPGADPEESKPAEDSGQPAPPAEPSKEPGSEAEEHESQAWRVAEAAPRQAPVDPAHRVMPRLVISAEEALAVPEAALMPPNPSVTVLSPKSPERSGKAIAALVFGILAFPVVGILVGWFAVGFGLMALRDIRQDDRLCGRKLAISGLWLGVLSIALWFGLFVVFGSSIVTRRFENLPQAPSSQLVNSSAAIAASGSLYEAS